MQVALNFFKLHARVAKSACKILKGIFAQFTRQKIGANGRMTVLPAFLRFLDGSFIEKKPGEIHKRSCEFFEADNLLTLVADFFLI